MADDYVSLGDSSAETKAESGLTPSNRKSKWNTKAFIWISHLMEMKGLVAILSVVLVE